MRDPADAEPMRMQSSDPGSDTYIVDHATDTGGTKGAAFILGLKQSIYRQIAVGKIFFTSLTCP